MDIAALNASKIAHCKNDGKPDILHFLFENQELWAKGSKIEDINNDKEKYALFKKRGITQAKKYQNT